MKYIKLLTLFSFLVSFQSLGMSREQIYNLCINVPSLETAIALQSLQQNGEVVPFYNTQMLLFRLRDEQVSSIIENYKKRPGDARLRVQYPVQADSFYIDNCMADPARYIPNYENLKSVYK